MFTQPLILALDVPGPWDLVAIIIGLFFGAFAGIAIHAAVTGRNLTAARLEGERIVKSAWERAEAKDRELEQASEERIQQRRDAADHEVRQLLANAESRDERSSRREGSLDRRDAELERREVRLRSDQQELERRERESAEARGEVDRILGDLRVRLEGIAGMSRAEAREAFLAEVRGEVEREANQLSRKIIEEAELEARQEAREITLMAIQRFAAENVAESTVRPVKLPSNDLKGRVIGRDGRNIRALERTTGADVLVDDTPGLITVSCFNPIRRVIAAEALQKLVSEGKVNPSRIEEVVGQTRRDIRERVRKAGKDAVLEADVRGLHGKIVETMGELNFRTSYGQNVLRHSIEVAYIAQVIADQLGLDGGIARRAGFLHDIGKAMDHELEGGHPAIGMAFAKKYGEQSEEVLNAIGGHHGEIPCTTPYTPIVAAADAISGARPGARKESMEMHIKRLEDLEAIAREFTQVKEAYAVQAGREVRVIVDAGDADDDRTHGIARELARRIEERLTYPGEIKVTVLREVRAEASAK